ncbi:hypothetical protein NDU88_001102 [Pleurodeles waltl]|uniref:Uncharacterized protein n=1 Tax=Pleurodeles waltl TaxID=8319 RepID=A0AAV7LWV3_PLEWA|nr:hypothetical protein NDU88_001102 [Pleurodeles waltl]
MAACVTRSAVRDPDAPAVGGPACVWSLKSHTNNAAGTKGLAAAQRPRFITPAPRSLFPRLGARGASK